MQKKILDKKGAKKGGGGGSGDKKKANQEKSIGTLQSLGVSKPLIAALYSFFDGGDLTPQQTARFEKIGLMTTNENGLTSLTRPGRLLRTAVNAGDDRRIKDAFARAAELIKKQQTKTAKTEESNMNDFDETETNETDNEEFLEMWGESYPFYGVTSFAQLETIKQANEIRENVMKTTYAFTAMVNNIVTGESENKVDDLKTLFNEYVGIMGNALNGETMDENNDEPFTEKEIAVHHTSIVENEPWDGPGAVADAPNDPAILKYMSAWMDENGDPVAKSTYKFPHHAPRKGSGANIRAVNNGLARLSQAKIPNADRPLVERHLRAHRVDAGLEEFMAQDEIKTAVNIVALAEGMNKEEKTNLMTAVLEQETLFIESQTEFDVLGTAVSLVESAATPDTPLFMNVRLIRPGWGNRRDNHYYPKHVLKRDANVFNEIKMHVTNHKNDEQNDRFWVSTIVEAGKRFDDDGAPIVRVAVHEPDFARRVRNLAELNLLHMLQCSIVASGQAKPNYKENGRSGSLVERITYAKSVDWVTAAGAGGQALNLIEIHSEDEHMNEMNDEHEFDENEETTETTFSENENTDETTVDDNDETNDTTSTENAGDEQQPQFIERAVVSAKLIESKLPDASRMRIMERDYETDDELQTAIQREIEYIAQITGAAQPHQFEGDNETVAEFDQKEADKRFDEIFVEFGVG